MISWSDLLCSIDGFWTAAVNHIWQATLFGALIALFLSSFRKIPAAIRHLLCLIALSKFLLSSALLAAILRPFGFDLRVLFFDVIWIFRDPKWLFLHQQQQLFPLEEVKQPYFALAGLIAWAIGFCLVLQKWISRQRDFAAKINAASSNARLENRLRRLSKDMNLSKTPGLHVSRLIEEPGVWRVLRPVIVIPESMTDRLNEKELDAVLLHEFMHIKRQDNLIAHFNFVVCAIFWFHPLVWWLDRKMLAEREVICDARVVEATGTTADYRNGLLKVLTLGSGIPIAGISCAGGGDFRDRISTLMRSPMTSHSRHNSLKALLPVFIAVLLVVILTIAAVPVLPCDGGIWFQYTFSQLHS